MQGYTKIVGFMGAMACAAILTLACGGGGGGGGGGEDRAPDTILAIDQDSAAMLVGATMNGQSLRDLSSLATLFGPVSGLPPSSARGASSASDLIVAVISQFQRRPLGATGDFQANASEKDISECDAGGSMSVNRDWDGLQDPQACWDVTNLDTTVEMTECGLANIFVMNGSAFTSTTGPMCAPSAMSVTFNDFRLDEVYAESSVYFGHMTITVSDIVWSSQGNWITHAKTVISGDTTETRDGITEEAEFHQFTVIFNKSDPVGFSLDISGALRGGCLGDEWASVDTPQPILFDAYADCPFGGQIELSGTGSEIVTFNSDGSVDVGTNHLDTCSASTLSCTTP